MSSMIFEHALYPCRGRTHTAGISRLAERMGPTSGHISVLRLRMSPQPTVHASALAVGGAR